MTTLRMWRWRARQTTSRDPPCPPLAKGGKRVAGTPRERHAGPTCRSVPASYYSMRSGGQADCNRVRVAVNDDDGQIRQAEA